MAKFDSQTERLIAPLFKYCAVISKEMLVGANLEPAIVDAQIKCSIMSIEDYYERCERNTAVYEVMKSV